MDEKVRPDITGELKRASAGETGTEDRGCLSSNFEKKGWSGTLGAGLWALGAMLGSAVSRTEFRKLGEEVREAGFWEAKTTGEPEQNKIRSLKGTMWSGESFGEATVMRDREVTKINKEKLFPSVGIVGGDAVDLEN